MTPELWQRISAALDHLADLPADQAEGYLGRLAERDPEVAEQVRGLHAGQDPRLSERLERLPRSQARALWEHLARPPETGVWQETPSSSSLPSFPFLAPPEAPDELGRLGGYRVLRVLGQGGMGIVFEAEERQPLRRVALKVMQPELARQEQAARRRFLHEGDAAASVEHERVVPIFRVDEAGGVPFLVMPLLPGESLEQRLQRQPRLPVAEVLRVGREAAEGLAAAHQKGLVHRDVKPANIWLREPGGSVVLLDFGLARSWQERGLTEAGMIVGTRAYLSPEQAAGEPADQRSDLFSLGCVLYRLCTGRLPFPGPGVLRSSETEALGRLRPPSEVDGAVPPGLSALVMRLLAWKPEDRPASAAAVVQALRELEAGQPAATAGQATKEWSGRPAERRPFRRWAVAAGVVLLMMSCAGVGGWWLNRSGDPTRGSPPPGAPPHYRGQIDVLVQRAVQVPMEGRIQSLLKLLRLDDPRTLPLRRDDKFRIEATVDPPAYVYIVWVDPGQDVTPVYPWDPVKGWGTRPEREEPVSQPLVLPAVLDKLYEAPPARPGVATMVLLARPTPLDVPDEEVRRWFEQLPELPLAARDEHGAVWFDNYREVDEKGRARTFAVVGAGDPFVRWQGQLRQAVGDRATFQTAVSFARTGKQ
jgi:serine/threonine protein kinase